MKLEGEHIFKGPRKEVWEMFLDPTVLASALPGTQKFKKVNENEYELAMNVRVGPVSGAFSGKMVLSDVHEPESCTLTAEGKGAPGFAKGVGRVHFSEQADGTTLLKYDGDLQVGGTLASVGQRMLDSVSKSMIRQGFEALDKALEARLATEAGQAVDYKPPTEGQIASGVAKDMGKELLKVPEVRMVLYVVPLLVVFALIGFLLSRCSGG